MTLTEFLLARIAEDEAVARGHEGTAYHSWTYVPHTNALGGAVVPPVADDWRNGGYVPVSEHIARHDPARVLAECEAKRAIVAAAIHAEKVEGGGADIIMRDGYPRDGIKAVLCALAAVYADHPDYREEWHP